MQSFLNLTEETARRARTYHDSPTRGNEQAILPCGLVARNSDRSHYPLGVARQFLAILASGSRVPLLKHITAYPESRRHDIVERLERVFTDGMLDVFRPIPNN
jgi:hypothetical protein